MLSRPSPFCVSWTTHCPIDRSRCDSGTARSSPRRTAAGPPSRCARPTRSPTRCSRPGQLGLSRAYVSGALDVDDLDAVLEVLAEWQPPPIERADAGEARPGGRPRIRPAAPAARAARGAAASAAAATRRERDARAVRHHYDVSNEFFALFLGESMTYSCAIFSRGAKTLEEAQETKLELVCTKLALQPGQRVLDVGCGWGSFAMHAATRHGVRWSASRCPSPRPSSRAARVAERGPRRQGRDPRAGLPRARRRAVRRGRRASAWSSTSARTRSTCTRGSSRDSCKPGGRVLNHGIARLRHGEPEAGAFSERYVFPDARAAAPVAHPARARARRARDPPRGGLRERLRGDAAPLGAPPRRQPRRGDPRSAGAERLRVWRLYLRAARRGFETGFTSIYQVRCSRPT